MEQRSGISAFADGLGMKEQEIVMLIADVHTHTIASGHAYGTIREMARAGEFTLAEELLKDISFPDRLVLNTEQTKLLGFLLS